MISCCMISYYSIVAGLLKEMLSLQISRFVSNSVCTTRCLKSDIGPISCMPEDGIIYVYVYLQVSDDAPYRNSEGQD